MEQENSLIPEEEIKNPEILETSTNDEPVVAESKAVENAKEKKESTGNWFFYIKYRGNHSASPKADQWLPGGIFKRNIWRITRDFWIPV